jgi:hypothetical protein
MDLAALAEHAGTTPAELLPYLELVGHPLTIAIALYYAIKAVIFLVAATVAICTKDEKRRAACLVIVRAVCRGWPWPTRLSDSQP